MKESDLQQNIIDTASKFGYWHYHTHDSRRSDPGFPDLVLVHEGKGRVLFIEAKSEDGQLTPEQIVWVDALARCGEEVYVPYPKHQEEIAIILMLDHKPSVLARRLFDCAVVYVEERC